MPYTGSPDSIERDQVRVLVGDLSTSNEFLGDAEYDFFVDQTPNIWIAAQLAANSLAAKFAGAAASASGDGFVEKTVGDLKIKKSDAVQTSREYRSLAAEFGKRAAAGIAPYLGGASISDKSSVTANTDRPAPLFVARLFDNTNATDFTGRSTST